MIPENKRTAVEKALLSAFNVNEFDSIQQLTKGLSSALIFKITVRDQPYLLRVITRTDAMADPSYYFDCMKSGAEAGLGPKIHYLNAEDRISITDFIEAQSFDKNEARRKLARLLRKLHGLEKFPFRINYFDAMAGFIKKFRVTNIAEARVTKDVLDLYEYLISIYPRNDRETWVSCHNDLKPENILFDGRRPWLVDWEGAFLNDRYLDLAVVKNFVVKNDEEEDEFLRYYFDEPVGEYQYARLFVMSQLLHIYYFVLFILFGSKGEPVNIDGVRQYEFRDFNDRVWNGEIDLSENEAKLEYALVHRDALLRNRETHRFKDCVKIVASKKEKPANP